MRRDNSWRKDMQSLSVTGAAFRNSFSLLDAKKMDFWFQLNAKTASGDPWAKVQKQAVSSMADSVTLRHGRLSTGYDCASSVKQEVSFKQNKSITQHFDMTSGDFDEMEEEFFPEDRHVIGCG